MAYEKNPNEIGALWIKTSKKGIEFMSGTINGVDVVCFRANKKTEKQPDWNVLKSELRDDSKTRQRDAREAPRRDSQVDDVRTYESDDDGF